MIYRFAGIAVDEDRDEIRRDGEPVRAQKKVRDLLLYLIRRRDRLVPKEELFEALWPGVVVNEAALTQAVYGARRVVGDDARNPQVLETVRGRGVRFIAPVRAMPREGVEVRQTIDCASEPSASDASGVPRFVGRERLLEELDGALRAASVGEGGVFLMAGEPGIGKTRAAEEFADIARARGAAVYMGRCHEAPGAPAFWPWVQMLRSKAETCDASELTRLLGSGAEDVAQIAPEIVPQQRARVQPDGGEALVDPSPARFRVFDAVTRLWQRVAEEQPLVLIIDDLHRADPPSWRLLHFLAREVQGRSILVVGTYRDAEAHYNGATAELLAELARQPRVRSIQMEGLPRAAVEEIVRQETGRALTRASLDTFLERTNGNPYFVVHLTTLLAKASENGSAGDLDCSQLALPRTLREAVARQVAGLPPRGLDILGTASVIGRSFSLGVLAPTTGASRADLLAMLDTCAKVGLVRADYEHLGHFEFSHILVRDALYESLPAARRTHLHAQVGSALEHVYADDLEPHFDELAHHFSAASHLENAEKAFSYSHRAAVVARERLAFEDAAKHYQTAIALIESLPYVDANSRCRLYLGLGEAQTRAGNRDAARANFAEAARLAVRVQSTEMLADVALATAPGLFSIESGVFDHFTVSMLEWALDSLDPEAHRLRAQALARLAMALYWSDDDRRRLDLVRESLYEANASNDASALAYASAAGYAAQWTPDTLDDRIRQRHELVSYADQTKDLSLRLMTRVFVITTLLENGQFADYYAAVRDFQSISSLHGDPHSRWYACLFEANVALMKGDVDSANEFATAFYDLGSKLEDVNATHAYSGHLATIAIARRQAKGIARHAQAQVLNYPSMSIWKCAAVFLLALEGRFEETESILHSLLEPNSNEPRRDMNYVFSLGVLSFAAGLVQSREAAGALYPRLEPYQDRHLVAGYASLYWGSACRPLAVLADLLGLKHDARALSSRARRCEYGGNIDVWWAHTVEAAARGSAVERRRMGLPEFPKVRGRSS